MYLFFEEDGNFKVGNILKQDGSTYQVELASGKRTKVKGGHVFFEFEAESSAAFLEKVAQVQNELDPAFLWEAAGDEEFSFETLAKDYFTEPKAHERAALLTVLHTNPVYFYRKGRGVYKKAPQEILKRALEAVAKRVRQEERRREMAQEMIAGSLPEEIAKNAFTLLIAPDKNGIEYKALNDAASACHTTPLRLLLNVRAIRSPFYWHVDGFYLEHFPNGRNFSKSLPKPEITTDLQRLRLADVTAFSIDDSNTTEIDDALSVTILSEMRARIGVHIAAPSLYIERDSPVDAVARERMSTVYAPGIKTTMLPQDWIQMATLEAGKAAPALSLYITVDTETMSVEATETCLEMVKVKDNLRYDTFEQDVTDDVMLSGTLAIPYAKEIALLWRFAKARQRDRELYRGKPEQPSRVEWYFDLEGDDENARITLKKRMRGAPIDLVISELMIYTNTMWGLWLEEHNVCGIYRSQHMGRVRMSTSPEPHDGLGVERYAWSTSPLRRYVDLVNQRQLVSAVMGMAPTYRPNDTDLFSIVSSFESVYDSYNDFQRKMERYWSLRWIEQEGLKEIIAVVIKGDLVRIDGLPFVQRIPGLPELERGRKVRLGILGCDLVDIVLETRFIETLNETGDLNDIEENDALAEIQEAVSSEREEKTE